MNEEERRPKIEGTVTMSLEAYERLKEANPKETISEQGAEIERLKSELEKERAFKLKVAKASMRTKLDIELIRRILEDGEVEVLSPKDCENRFSNELFVKFTWRP